MKFYRFTSREAAFLSLLNWEQDETLITNTLEELKKKWALSQEDVAFAFELSCQVMRKKRLLDFIGKTLSKNKKLPAKQKEKILLRLSLYQLLFLKNIPLHAICNEMVEVAKQTTNKPFSNFLNAFIRNCDRNFLPMSPDLATSYSYTDFFVETLIKVFGKEKTEEILHCQNEPAKLCARRRKQEELEFIEIEQRQIAEISKSENYYIQNKTQPTLLQKLKDGLKIAPKAVLDLCAAPGGKLLFLADSFSNAELFANDVSESRLKLLQENLLKYNVKAQISCNKGEELDLDKRFDLVVVDPPCSSSGVLYKCPEARWKITEEYIQNLNLTQFALLEAARRHLKPDGKIWYLTCSILPQENENLVRHACEKLTLKIEGPTHTILPSRDGFEGGFACQLAQL